MLSLVAFNILSLIFAILVAVGVLLFGFILFRALCVFWTWMSVSFPKLVQLLRLQICSLFLSVFSFWGLYNVNIINSMLDVVSEVSETVLIFSNYFTFFCSASL